VLRRPIWVTILQMTVTNLPLAQGDFTPYVVGIGGTSRPNSSTEQALGVALAAAAAAGARTLLMGGSRLDLPLYVPERSERAPAALALVEELRRADGVIIASPGYHGSISGMVKNALDYTEDLRADERMYFDGRAVGCIATGSGWQGAVATLNALRGIVHALRGWNTPIGVAINTVEYRLADGRCSSPVLTTQLQEMGRQVVAFARMHEAARTVASLPA
jgi:FMN reductase